MDLIIGLINGDLSLITPAFIISQVLGIITMIISTFAAQFKNITTILFAELIANLLVAASYIFIGADSGFYICLAACIQIVVSYVLLRLNKPVPKVLVGVFITMFVVLTAIFYTGWFDVFSGLGAVMCTLSVVQKKPMWYRIFIGFNALFWIVYDVAVNNYALMITHVLLLVSVIIALIRFKNQEEPKKE